MRVSIVIPVVTDRKVTAQCIRALRENTTTDYELIVVDNASDAKMQRMLKYEKIDKLIRNEENLGFGKAVNQGWEAAEGDILATINNDTVPGARWLELLVDTLKDERIGLTGKFGGFLDGGYKCMYIEPHYAREVDYIEGSCLAMRRDVYEAVGGFRDMFSPAYCEDTDLSIRVHRKNYRVVCRPDIEFQHMGGHTTAQIMENSEFRSLWERNTQFLITLYGLHQSVFHTHWPVTLLWQGEGKTPRFEIAAQAQNGFPIPRYVRWESVFTYPDFDAMPTDWVFLLKEGERLAPQLLASIPKMTVRMRDAWMISVPGDKKQMRMFRKSACTWDNEKQEVSSTETSEAGDYKGGGVVSGAV